MTKRAFDVSVTSIVILVFAPLLALISLAVLVSLGRPILFRQIRPGLQGEPFQLIKFRTMRPSVATDGGGTLEDDDASRMTRLGKLLRLSSLDELPELWNVLRGDMSLVGPRPLLMEYLSLYTDQQRRRLEVRPGITGWAQVNGRNAVSWEQRFALDVWYVDHQSFWLDLRILCLTVGKVLKQEGVTGEGVATMSRFRGSKDDING